MAKNTTTRWDALSMRDRASLIKLYSQSGIKKLDDMRAHYNRFDMGGDKENDALAKAIIDRVNQEEAAKARVEGVPMMGEKPLESEDYLFGLAAIGAKAPITGTLSAVKETAPYWGKAGLRMLRDLPAFEFVDRLPTVFGGKRMTELGGDATQTAYEAITGNHNLSNMSRTLVRLPGEFIAGVVPGVAGDVLMQKGASLATRGLNALSGADGRIFNSQIVRNPENFYRSVDKEAILDAKNSGLIRGSFPDSDFPGSPYFARSQEPFSWRKYVIEGNRDSADKWISASGYNNGEIRELPAKPPYDFSGSYEGVPREISSADYSNFINEYEAFPMTDGSVNSSKAHNFVYWQKHPLLGWRKHSFTSQKTGSFREHAAALRSLNNRGFQMANSLDYLEPLAHETNVVPAMPKSVTAKMPVASIADANAYEIADLGGGYMLKSLMRGNPLEKQISKNGTVNVNNVRALVGKGSKVEQAVVDKVLASEEFAGKKAIDYNKFRKAVQDELITYERTPDTRYEDYGTGELGFLRDVDTYRERQRMLDRFVWDHDDVEVFYGAGRNSDGTSVIFGDGKPEDLTMAEIIERFRQHDPAWFSGRTIPGESASTIKTNTYTFSSPRIPRGSSKHYNANTLGHSRTYTTVDEPDVLHVMESQSDWAQAGKEANKKRGIRSLNRDEVEANINSLRRNIAREEALLEVSDSQIKQEDYLIDNYTSRQIQENLRYAAEKGQTKMRYPTRETAAKIEGYPAREAYFDAQGKDITNSGQSIYTFGEKLDKELKDINDKLAKLQEYDYRWDVRDKMTELFERKNNILKGESQLRPGITKKTVYDYEDILKKYTKFPEQYRKLYKDAEVRTVSDRMGNTWYEVDVPKDYLNQEWAYANGGPLVNMFYTGGDKDTMKNLAYKIGAYVHDGAGATPFGLLKAVTSPQQNYDELKAYLWGPENVGFEPYTGTSTKPYLGNNIPTYNATINPNGQYVFPENMKGFIEEIANRNGNIYLNADLMPGSDKPRYDAANYPVNLFYDNNGNIAGNAADLYDFGINYSNHYSKTPKWQIKAMRKQGVPYAVRQDNIPFVFSNSPEAENTVTALSYGEMGNKNKSDEAIINAMSRLGNGTIEPASITFEYPERLENYASGGKIHIKPENRGKFTALKKRTGKTASWFKAHGTPAQKKMATFALNVAKWHKK